MRCIGQRAAQEIRACLCRRDGAVLDAAAARGYPAHARAIALCGVKIAVS